MYEIDEDIKEMAIDMINAIYKCFGKYFQNPKKDG